MGGSERSASPSSGSDSAGPSTPTTTFSRPSGPLPKDGLPLDSAFQLPESLAHARQLASAGWDRPYTFHTLEQFQRFQQPSKDEFQHPELLELSAPQIESFNMLWSDDPSVTPTPAQAKALGPQKKPEGEGLLAKAVRSIQPRVSFDGHGASPEQWLSGEAYAMGNRLEMWIDNVNLARPAASERSEGVRDPYVYPSEARERLVTYAGTLTARIQWSVNGGPPHSETKSFGQVPIMVRVRTHTSDLLLFPVAT